MGVSAHTLVMARGHIVLLLLAVAFCSASSFSVGCDPAPKCDKDQCNADTPECHCSGEETHIDDADRPQIVYLTYDDAFSAYTEENFYRSIFDSNDTDTTFTNPDGCRIRATHFVSAMYTDYFWVNHYRNLGHEMASHSITHRTNDTYWKNLDEEGHKKEFHGMKQMLAQFANVPINEIIGTRVPFLIAGGEAQFTMMQNNGFKYDCSMPTRLYGYIDADRGLYPYTLDYKSKQDCEVGTCPKCSYPGMWVQPMIDLEDNWHANPNTPEFGMPCSMLDACIGFQTGKPEEITEFLRRNFDRVYNGDRAPWGLYMHAAWFYGAYSWHYEGYKQFLKDILELPNVWVVPIRDGIEYMKDPKTNDELLAQGKDSVFGCNFIQEKDYKRSCGRTPINCRFGEIENEDIHNEERYINVCTEVDGDPQGCPPNYPWLGDPCGGADPCNE